MPTPVQQTANITITKNLCCTGGVVVDVTSNDLPDGVSLVTSFPFTVPEGQTNAPVTFEYSGTGTGSGSITLSFVGCDGAVSKTFVLPVNAVSVLPCIPDFAYTANYNMGFIDGVAETKQLAIAIGENDCCNMPFKISLVGVLPATISIPSLPIIENDNTVVLDVIYDGTAGITTHNITLKLTSCDDQIEHNVVLEVDIAACSPTFTYNLPALDINSENGAQSGIALTLQVTRNLCCAGDVDVDITGPSLAALASLGITPTNLPLTIPAISNTGILNFDYDGSVLVGNTILQLDLTGCVNLVANTPVNVLEGCDGLIVQTVPTVYFEKGDSKLWLQKIYVDTLACCGETLVSAKVNVNPMNLWLDIFDLPDTFDMSAQDYIQVPFIYNGDPGALSDTVIMEFTSCAAGAFGEKTVIINVPVVFVDANVGLCNVVPADFIVHNPPALPVVTGNFGTESRFIMLIVDDIICPDTNFTVTVNPGSSYPANVVVNPPAPVVANGNQSQTIVVPLTYTAEIGAGGVGTHTIILDVTSGTHTETVSATLVVQSGTCSGTTPDFDATFDMGNLVDDSPNAPILELNGISTTIYTVLVDISNRQCCDSRQYVYLDTVLPAGTTLLDSPYPRLITTDNQHLFRFTYTGGPIDQEVDLRFEACGVSKTVTFRIVRV